MSEWVTGVIVIVVSLTVGFGFFVSNQRNATVDQTREALTAIKSQIGPVVKNAIADGTLLRCDDDLIGAEMLAHDYLTLSVRPLPINPYDYTEGFLPSVYVASNRKTDGNEIFDTAKRLHSSLDEEDTFTLRLRKKEDDEIAFSIVVSESPVCTDYVHLQSKPKSDESKA